MNLIDPARLRADPSAVAAYRADGFWRTGTVLDDLRHAARTWPRRTAIDARTAGGSATRLTYEEYAALVERWARALHGLGVRPGEAVAYQLPNVWQSPVFHLACLRAGVVAVPLRMNWGSREVERILHSTGAVLVVTCDRWEGEARDRPVAEAAAKFRLPRLRHRLVLGDAARTGAAGFDERFPRDGQDDGTARELAPPDPDRAFVVLFTSGTTGEPKGIVHTANTLHAAVADRARLMAREAGDREPGDGTVCTPYTLGHIAGLVIGVWSPVMLGWAAVHLDVWDPAAGLDLLAETATCHFSAFPAVVSSLVDEQRRRPRELSLTAVNCSAAPVPARLGEEVRRHLGARMFITWGSTEAPGGTVTRVEDPEHWTTRSEGRPAGGLRLRLAPDEHCTPPVGRLFVAGPSVCVAAFDRDSGQVLWRAEEGDGWYDTGDHACPDGHDGIRIVGRVPDRVIGPDACMIPVRDIEDALREHEAVRDAAVIGVPDPVHGELACAVVEPVRPKSAPTHTDLRTHLTRLGFPVHVQPSSTRIVEVLPRNATGKVLRHELRLRYAT